MTYEKYYKIKAQCYICEHISLQCKPKIDCVGIKTVCDLNPDNDLPESQFCEKFEACELLDYL